MCWLEFSAIVQLQYKNKCRQLVFVSIYTDQSFFLTSVVNAAKK
jgi:hypothetical protein